MCYSNQVVLQQKKIGNELIKYFSLARILLGILAFSTLQAIDSAKESLDEKNQEKALIDEKTKNNHQTTPKHQIATPEKSAFFIGIGYSGMASGWKGLFQQNWLFSNLSDSSSQAILNGFNVEVGYQYISKKYPNIGLRAGFLYSYKAQNLIKNFSIQDFNNKGQPWGQSIGVSGLGISMNIYSLFVDFLNDFYQSKKFFVGWFLGAGFGGESVSFNNQSVKMMNVTQFQGFGTLGLRGGNKHHTLEVSGSVHGDMGNCAVNYNSPLSACSNSTPTNTTNMYGLWTLYVTWNVNYVYRF
ncbi:outer membrane beta-barrel protein [Helicobacter cetorum]|uniref:outer membrane beta-barrel protein n=1 Tax=Helicobacter cetorum TaxID=138563 RepID=UPI000CF179E0|nr:outer membrane beta-barrel protein [Helicobacter cetorum]